ncbi:phosphoenolpyruvate carboxylase, partial [Bordetella petrii]|uniref:phosphoenolpyruvate carboxylase n=1 Tax=Bordetella petrii TaxID=94624 RepID=UPI001E2E6641
MKAIRPQSATAEPLRHDIRLLGRLLGQVIQACEGERVFDTIETLRRTAVRFRREGKEADGKLLEQRVKRLRDSDPNSVARAFSYFLHLSNIAEDRDQNRAQRTLALADDAPARGSLREAVALLKEHGVSANRIRRLLNEACVVPVLTAHPTEVQRKSTLDVHREIAGLLLQREGPLTTQETADLDLALLGRVATLWQTRMLRYTRLTVADEIENALSYYRSTFLNVIPRVYGEMSRLLSRDAAKPFAAPPAPLEPFLRMGSWIGGDRDGNPNVDAGTLELALLRQATVLFEYYLQEVHALGAELSITTLLIQADPALHALADAGGDDSPHRRDEPYRRALVGIYARLSATAQKLTGRDLARRVTHP